MFRARSVMLVALSLILASCDGAVVERETPPGGAAADIAGARNPAEVEGQTLHVIMQGLERDMITFMHSLWREDFEGMRVRAAALAEHPEIAPAEVERIQGVLGDEMAGFEEADEVVHEASIRLSRAAEAGDLAAVLRELSAVQAGCVACHTRYRDRLHTH